MSPDDIILELLQVLLTSRHTLLRIHNEASLDMQFSWARDTEWNIFAIDDAIRKIGPSISKEVRDRYVQSLRSPPDEHRHPRI